jgi:hypothetical protein
MGSMAVYRAGARVRIEAEGTVDARSGGHYDTIRIDTEHGYFYVEVGDKLEPFVKVLADPLPTKAGIYVPGNNRGVLESSYLYILTESGEWRQFDGKNLLLRAEAEAKNAHEKLGGLVPLVAAP